MKFSTNTTPLKTTSTHKRDHLHGNEQLLVSESKTVRKYILIN